MSHGHRKQSVVTFIARWVLIKVSNVFNQFGFKYYIKVCLFCYLIRKIYSHSQLVHHWFFLFHLLFPDSTKKIRTWTGFGNAQHLNCSLWEKANASFCLWKWQIPPFMTILSLVGSDNHWSVNPQQHNDMRFQESKRQQQNLKSSTPIWQSVWLFLVYSETTCIWQFYGILHCIFNTASISMAFYKALMKATKIYIVLCDCVFESHIFFVWWCRCC